MDKMKIYSENASAQRVFRKRRRLSPLNTALRPGRSACREAVGTLRDAMLHDPDLRPTKKAEKIGFPRQTRGIQRKQKIFLCICSYFILILCNRRCIFAPSSLK